MRSEGLAVMIPLCGCKNLVDLVCLSVHIELSLIQLDEMVIWLITEVD